MKIHFNSAQMIAILERHGIDVIEEKIFGCWINVGGPHEQWHEYDMHVPYKDGQRLISQDAKYYTSRGPYSMLEYELDKIISEKMFELLIT